MRPKLHEIMSREVRRLETGVRLGIKAERFDQADDQVCVAFTDGSEGVYDLVVACDGIYSQTRAMLFPDAVQPQYIGQMSWRVIAPRPPEMDKAEFFFGHEHVAGINPCSQEEVYGFVLNPEPEIARLDPSQEPEVLRGLMADFGGHMAEIREGIGPHSSIMRRPFEYAFQPKPWHVGRIILIGDAVHATTPHLASGAGIAVEDALVLAQELERLAPDVHGALVAFTERRFERCRHVVESSVAIGKRQLGGAQAPEIGKRMAEAMQFLAGPI
jgi:2-polyprenyl-6-methoxyphenol hydroxylase-like FAD-dependent oxidoreductase